MIAISSKSAHHEPRDLSDVVEEIDDICRTAFTKSSVGQIECIQVLRIRVLTILLKGLGDYSPGNNEDTVLKELSDYIGTDACNILTLCGEKLKQVLRVCVGIDPTYSAASYWSPIDQRRHTVTHRPVPATPNGRTYILATAYAFYALTLAGPRHRLHSVIHYIAEIAERKRGVRVSYEADCPPGWWHIPPTVHHILGQTGLSAAIDRTVLKAGQRSEADLESLLSLTLDNRADAEWVDVDGFASDFLASFTVQKLPSDERSQAAIRHTQLTLNRVFEADISEKEALFMLMTHLLYREACPTSFIYTYPVQVIDTCCVMTIGTRELIPSDADLVLHHLVRSVFTRPLLLDYSARESAARIEAERNALWEQTALNAAHRIGTPVANVGWRLDLLQDYLDRQDHANAQLSLAQAREEARRANDIIYDFKRLAVHNLKPSVASVRVFLNALSEDALARGFRCDLQVEGTPHIAVDEIRWKECLEEILKNATRWCSQDSRSFTMTASEVPGSQILPPGPMLRYVELHFRDNGPGVSDDDKLKIFDPFVSRHPAGSGLGLPYVKRIVEAHAGRIAEVGQKGQGADFVILLPAASKERNAGTTN